MAPTFSTLTSLLRRSTTTIISRNEAANDRLSSLGPLAARAILTARDDSPPPAVDPTRGAINPHDINNNAIFALFGLLGAAFVITGIWFFFWAKNGGFVFKENDWDEYKSTVMRRRGPNGTLLSGATPSTQLGGGSIYKDVYDDGSTEYTGAGNGDGADLTTVVSATTGITGITGGVSDIYGREKRRKKREQKEREKEREKERRREEKERGKSKSRRKVGVDGALIDEDAEAEAKAHLREYRHEKAARVGGINKESEGSSWDGSTNPSHSTVTGSSSGYTATETGSTVTSELIANRERTPTKKTEEKRGIRKVYSTADKNDRRENERLRAEAKRLREQEKMNARSGAGPSSGGGGRRDFSWSKTDETMALRKIDEQTEVSESVVTGSESYVGTESRVPGGWGEESDIGTSDLGTKVYRHPVHIPITSSAGGPSTPAPAAPSTVGTASEVSYAEEKRKKRGGAGYRRDRDREGRA